MVRCSGYTFIKLVRDNAGNVSSVVSDDIHRFVDSVRKTNLELAKMYATAYGVRLINRINPKEV